MIRYLALPLLILLVVLHLNEAEELANRRKMLKRENQRLRSLVEELTQSDQNCQKMGALKTDLLIGQLNYIELLDRELDQLWIDNFNRELQSKILCR